MTFAKEQGSDAYRKDINRCQVIHRADLPALGLLAPPSLVSPTVTDGTGKGLKWVAVYMGQELSLFCHLS